MKKGQLQRWHLIGIGVNGMVGAGIFLIPGEVHKVAGPFSPLLYIASAVVLVPVAHVFATLSTLTDQSGGSYAYAKLAFPPWLAFHVGWLCWITSVVSCGAVASALGGYLGYFISGADTPRMASGAALILIAVFSVVNYFGAIWGGRTTTFLTIAKMVPLVLIAFIGLSRMSSETLFGVPPLIQTAGLWHALALILFSYTGFEVVPVLASESDQPKQNVRRAIWVSLGITTVLYTALQWAYSSTSGVAIDSPRPLSDLGEVLLGARGAAWVACAGLISIVGYVAGEVLGGPWYLAPLTDDGHLPKAIGWRHPKFRTPTIALAINSGVAALFVSMFGVSELISISVLSVAVQYLVSAAALLLILRRQGSTREYVLPFLALLLSAAFAASAPAFEWIVLASMLAIGVGLGWAFKRIR